MVTIIVAIVGALATISAAIIARKSGQQAGIERGQQHSIQKFLDVQKKQLDRAEDAAKRGDYVELRALATAIVDNTMQWRRIQENFRALLNGRVDDLNGTLRVGKPEQLVGTILALKEGFEGRALAVETELKKSAI